MTLEEAQDKILQLNEELKNNKDTLNTLNETIKNNDISIKEKDSQIEQLKEHNMKLFLKVANDENVFNNPDNGTPAPTENKTSWNSFKIELK